MIQRHGIQDSTTRALAVIAFSGKAVRASLAMPPWNLFVQAVVGLFIDDPNLPSRRMGSGKARTSCTKRGLTVLRSETG